MACSMAEHSAAMWVVMMAVMSVATKADKMVETWELTMAAY